jgi:hypothetical protein
MGLLDDCSRQLPVKRWQGRLTSGGLWLIASLGRMTEIAAKPKRYLFQHSLYGRGLGFEACNCCVLLGKHLCNLYNKGVR